MNTQQSSSSKQESMIFIKLISHDERYAHFQSIGETVGVPGTVTTAELKSLLVKQMDITDATKRNFLFILGDRAIDTGKTLKQSIDEQEFISEQVIEIEFIEPEVTPPKRKRSLAHDDAVLATTSLGGKWAMTGCLDGTTHVWNLTGEHISQMRTHEFPITCISAFYIDGEGENIVHIITGSKDAQLSIWEVRIEDKESVIWRKQAELNAHSDSVQSCAVSYDCRLLISGGWDGCIFVWDLQQIIKDDRNEQELIKKQQSKQSLKSHLGKQQEKVKLIEEDEDEKQIKVQKQKRKRQTEENKESEKQKDEQEDEDEQQSDHISMSIQTPHPIISLRHHRGAITGLLFEPNYQQEDNQQYIDEMDKDEIKMKQNIQEKDIYQSKQTLYLQQQDNTNKHVSKKSKRRKLNEDQNENIKQEDKEISQLQKSSQPLLERLFNIDGYFWSCGMDHKITQWDLQRRMPVLEYNAPYSIMSISGYFKPPSSQQTMPFARIITGHVDGCIRLWDPHSPIRISSRPYRHCNSGFVSVVAWCQDSDFQFISLGHDGRICVWDMRSPTALHRKRVPFEPTKPALQAFSLNVQKSRTPQSIKSANTLQVAMPSVSLNIDGDEYISGVEQRRNKVFSGFLVNNLKGGYTIGCGCDDGQLHLFDISLHSDVSLQ